MDSRGRTQYLYHQLWREQRDVQKFAHMLRFARALPELRAAALRDLKARGLRRERVVAGAVRLIDLGLFRVGGEKYAELDHHYGATTLLKQHVKVMRGGMIRLHRQGGQAPDDHHQRPGGPADRAGAGPQDNGLDALFCYEHGGAWHVLHSHQVNDYIAARAGGHFTAKEFRTWNATVLMALVLANAEPSPPQTAGA